MSISLYNKISVALRMRGPANTPRFASLFVTRKCNLACPYCKSIEQPFMDIDLAMWEQIIDKLYGFGCRLFSLTGGEPLVRKDIMELIRYICKEKKAVCWMISNFGLMTDAKINELADAGMQFITCSLDSLSGQGQKSAPRVLDLLSLAKHKGMVPATLTVITKNNIHEVPHILETVSSRGIMFDCGLYQNVGGLFSPTCGALKVTDKAALVAFVNNLKKAKRNGMFVAPSSKYLSTCIERYNRSDWKCAEDRDNFLVVNNNGSLMVCQEYDSGIPVLSLPSLTDNTWRTVKKQIVQSCDGCLYGCYFQKENISILDALLDAWTLLRI